MLLIDTADRPALEVAAIFEANMDLDVIEAMNDEQLRDALIEWVEAGDECGAC